MGSQSEKAYRIGEVAQLVGVTTRTIRYYEELGLLGCAGDRAKGEHRLYDGTNVKRLQELIRLRDLLGLTLDELVELAEAEEARAVLREEWETEADDAERLRILKAAAPLVARQLALVNARQATLTQFAADLELKLSEMRARERELAKSARLAAPLSS